MSIPHLCILLEVIIGGDFPMISFFILVEIFFIFGAIEKNRTDAYLIVFKIGVQLKKSAQCALYVIPHVFS
jgi:hypothetical protein